MSLFQNLYLLPDKLINNVGQVGDDEEGDHSQGEEGGALQRYCDGNSDSLTKIIN